MVVLVVDLLVKGSGSGNGKFQFICSTHPIASFLSTDKFYVLMVINLDYLILGEVPQY